VTEEGYTWSEHKSSYGGIEQRWLVVESNFRRDSDLGKLEKNSKKLKLKLRINCKNSPKLFACAADAAAAAHRLSKQLKFYNITKVSSKEITAQTDTNGYFLPTVYFSSRRK
jgi:transposase